MATNGQRIIYNPEFVENLTPAGLEGVLAHEVLHCALAHHCRRGSRELGLWNEACDYAVNPIVLDNGMALPAGVLVNPAFHDLSTEEIYAHLRKGREQQPPSRSDPQPGPESRTSAPSSLQADSSGTSQAQSDEGSNLGTRPGGFGEVLDAEGHDGKAAGQAEISRQEQEWSIAADQAVRSAKACGHIPGGVEGHLVQARIPPTGLAFDLPRRFHCRSGPIGLRLDAARSKVHRIPASTSRP